MFEVTRGLDASPGALPARPGSHRIVPSPANYRVRLRWSRSSPRRGPGCPVGGWSCSVARPCFCRSSAARRPPVPLVRRPGRPAGAPPCRVWRLPARAPAQRRFSSPAVDCRWPRFTAQSRPLLPAVL